MKEKTYRCPLCKSILSRDRYLQIIGVWEERSKLENSLKSQIRKLKDEKERTLKEKRRLKLEMKKQIQEAIKRGRQLEKARSDRLINMLENKTKEIQKLNKKLKEVQEQLKKGTSPQIEGFNLEEHIIKELKKEFPEDKFNHCGKYGDILQTINHKRKEIGRIIYECKNTDKYHSSFIDQVRKAIVKRNATYGVLITSALRKGSAGICVENDVIVVHPYGAIYIARILRQSIIAAFESNLDKSEIEKKAKDLMEFIQSEEFKNIIEDCIYKTRKLYETLIKEVNYHRSTWKSRYDYYNSINININKLQTVTNNILKGSHKETLQIKKSLELPPPNIQLD